MTGDEHLEGNGGHVSLKVFVCQVFLTAAIITPLAAQSYQGGVRGRFTDPAGSAVAGVKVSIVDEATNVSRNTVTNDAGEYVFSGLNPATYTIHAEAPGFKRLERKGVLVATQEFLTVDVRLELGAVSESVIVTEEVPLIETSNASTGQVIDRQKLADLPNSGRSPFMMAMIVPGVVPAGNPTFNRMQDQLGSSAVSLAGGPVRGNNYLLDGVPISDMLNRAIMIPTIETVQEVKIQVKTYDAEIGRTGGGIYNTLLKSGSNDVHGSAFGYLRQADWSANDFFRNRNGVARPDNNWKNYGFSIGGPVWLPKIYKGKDRTFFWVAGEAYRQRTADSQDHAAPTLAERTGDFSKSFNRDGTLKVIVDPFTKVPFPENKIPQELINKVGLNIASYFPLPSRPTAFFGANNYLGATLRPDRADQLTFKGDHSFTSWWRANASYLHYGSKEPSSAFFGPASFEAWFLKRKVDATQINNIFTPNATTVVSIRYGFNRFPNVRDAFSQGFNLAGLGLPASYVSAVQYPKFPRIVDQTFASLGPLTETINAVWHSKNLLGGVSKYMGRHSLKTGFDYRVINADFINYLDSAGVFTFDSSFSGSDLSNLLLGYPTSGSIPQVVKLETFVRYYAAYFHDDFRVSRKLTLNLGLRYEYETGLAERHNRITVGFDRDVVNPISGPAGVQARGGLLYAGVNGNRTTQGDPSSTKFSPRIGVAWQMNEKTTIRGGYGLFWAPPRNNVDANHLGAVGFVQNTAYVASTDGGRTPAGTLSNPFPAGILQPAGSSQGLLTGIGQNISFVDQHRRSGRVHQFSIDVQRQLPLGMALTAAYIASRSSHLGPGGTQEGPLNINQLPPDKLSLGAALLSPVTNPFFGKGGTGVIGSATVPQNQLLRPFPEFGAVTLYQSDFNHARYDSMVIKAEKRFAAGFTFLASYTFSNNMDAAWGEQNFYVNQRVPLTSYTPQNAYDLEAEYGLAVNNAPHRYILTATYELPFGRGRRYGNQNRVVDFAAGGWQFNVISIYQSGFPTAVLQNQNSNAPIGAGIQRPNLTGTAPDTTGSFGRRMDNWFNPAAFSTAPQFTYGNAPRTLEYRGPGQANWDLSLFKTFSIVERFKAQFRAESINLLNTPVFENPNSNFGNANFGRITRQANFPRFVQFGLRFIW